MTAPRIASAQPTFLQSDRTLARAVRPFIRFSHVEAAGGIVLVVACAIWVAAFAAIVSEYRDADGFVDCGDECSSVHYLAALGFLAPPLLISLSALGMILALGHRWRLRRTPADDNHA